MSAYDFGEGTVQPVTVHKRSREEGRIHAGLGHEETVAEAGITLPLDEELRGPQKLPELRQDLSLEPRRERGPPNTLMSDFRHRRTRGTFLWLQLPSLRSFVTEVTGNEHNS